MGNNRQILKDNIQTDLQKKIRNAEAILSELKDAVSSVERNSLESKLDLQEHVDSLQQRLTLRKLEITRQIDLLCHTQTNALQEGIRSTYIALGSLQSTLSHLDSFDHSQLINLHVPDFSWMQNITTPPPLETELESSKLGQQIDNWGSVSAKGFKGLIEIGSSVSMPQRFVEYSDGRPERELMCHKSVSAGSSSSVTMKTQPKLPTQSAPATSTNNTNNTVFRSQRDCSSPEKWHLEQWLDEIKSETLVENDDFEFVSFETDRTGTPKMQEDMLPIRDAEIIDGSQVTETEDGSSIVCIEKEGKGSQNLSNDLSQWLKPKKISAIPKPSTEVVVPKIQVGNKRPNAADSSFIDFPCLRLDPNCWIRERKNKRCFTTDLRISVSQKEIIPPTYALPNPFWLKRFCPNSK